MSINLVLTCFFINATLYGFLHPEVTFEMHMVDVPIEDNKPENVEQSHIVPLTASTAMLVIPKDQKNKVSQAE